MVLLLPPEFVVDMVRRDILDDLAALLLLYTLLRRRTPASLVVTNMLCSARRP